MELEDAIKNAFESTFKLKEDFLEIGMQNGCCGWLWLIVNNKYGLQLVYTSKNENPLLKHAEIKGVPLLAVDIWEHAYHARFVHDKREYLKAIWSIINWSEVSRRFKLAKNV